MRVVLTFLIALEFCSFVATTNGTMEIKCRDERYLDDTLKNLTVDEEYHVIILEKCPLPITSYSLFFSKIGINVTSLKVMVLRGIEFKGTLTLKAEHFKGLYIEELSLINSNLTHWAHPEKGFLDLLQSLKYIYVQNILLPAFPMSSKIVSAEFNNVDFPDIQTDSFGGCDQLQTVTFQSLDTELSIPWLSSCPRIDFVTISGIQGLFLGLDDVTIKNLNISNAQFTNGILPANFFKIFKNLEVFTISRTNLAEIILDSPLLHLKVLDLKTNEFKKGLNFNVTLQNTPMLVTLDLSNNLYFELCPRYDENAFSIEHANLKRLILDKTGSNYLACLTEGGLPSLEFLSLAGTGLQQLHIQNILISKKPLHVDLNNNSIKEVIMTNATFNRLLQAQTSKNVNITLDAWKTNSWSLDCQCNNGLFARALRQGLLKAHKAKCNGPFPEDIDKFDSSYLECKDVSCSLFYKDDGPNVTCECAVEWNLSQRKKCKTFAEARINAEDKEIRINHGYFECFGKELGAYYSTKDRPWKENATAILKECALPKNSFASDLSQVKIQASTLKKLILINDNNIEPLRAELFRGLTNLQELIIVYKTSDHKETSGIYYMSRPQRNFTDLLISLKNIYVSHVEMPPLSENSSIEVAKFADGVSIGPLGGCNKLRDLTLLEWKMNGSHYKWLEHCPFLTSLTMMSVTNSTMSRVLYGATTIKIITINNLIHIGDDRALDMSLFSTVHRSLSYLNLNNNQYKDIEPSPYEFSFLRLEIMELKSNFFTDGYIFNKTLMMMPTLITLDLSYNPDFELCRDFNNRHFTIGHQMLQQLVLEGTSTTSLACVQPQGLPKLKYLNLNLTKLFSFQFHQLLVSQISLKVFFNPEELNFTREDYATLNDRPIRINLIFGSHKFDCDCHHGFLAQAYRRKLLYGQGVRCRDNKELAQLLPVHLECDKFECDGCTCRRAWQDNTTKADCHGANIDHIPRVNGLSSVLASNNSIKNIYAKDLPTTLTYLDLRGNRIGFVDQEIAQLLFSDHRQVWLAGNSITCSCDNEPFIRAIQEHYQQVLDYHNLTCENKGLQLHRITKIELCPELKTLIISSVVGGSSVILTVLVLILLYRYRREILIFLYARGWCKCCINEDKLDADRLFDVFVSFCFADAELVMHQLVPQLEEYGYKTCTHYREWIPGEAIPTQIVRSVEESRRTIIVLSRNFLESAWGILEFRSAHVRALNEGVPRVIMVVLDDVVDMEILDPDLRIYLRTNTYIRLDDRWFWDRLRYALPVIENRRRQEDSVSPNEICLREIVDK